MNNNRPFFLFIVALLCALQPALANKEGRKRERHPDKPAAEGDRVGRPRTAASLPVATIDDMWNALFQRSEPLVRRVLDSGFYVNTLITKEAQTALLIAAHAGCPDIFRLLLSRYADIRHKDTGRNTALHWASANLEASAEFVDEVMDGFLVADLPISEPNWEGYTPLMVASRVGTADSVRLFRSQRRVNVNSAREDGLTALHLAAGRSDNAEEIIRELLAGGARANAMTTSKHTPLMEAATRGHINNFRALVLGGADVNLLGATGIDLGLLAAQGWNAFALLERQFAEPPLVPKRAFLRELLARDSALSAPSKELRADAAPASELNEITPALRARAPGGIVAFVLNRADELLAWHLNYCRQMRFEFLMACAYGDRGEPKLLNVISGYLHDTPTGGVSFAADSEEVVTTQKFLVEQFSALQPLYDKRAINQQRLCKLSQTAIAPAPARAPVPMSAGNHAELFELFRNTMRIRVGRSGPDGGAVAMDNLRTNMGILLQQGGGAISEEPRLARFILPLAGALIHTPIFENFGLSADAIANVLARVMTDENRQEIETLVGDFLVSDGVLPPAAASDSTSSSSSSSERAVAPAAGTPSAAAGLAAAALLLMSSSSSGGRRAK